ncbi:hypothetical protein CDAR_304331 [Caerostris darwini]|uniref:Uncharacterized protein n=1 Tax=Caerostris darwini TaxID=1538125 RepID=A0AAV4NXB2_9ARAC|nr:hypothetical protein CDAR_304331 [Caerostris darwini]
MQSAYGEGEESWLGRNLNEARVKAFRAVDQWLECTLKSPAMMLGSGRFFRGLGEANQFKMGLKFVPCCDRQFHLKA